MWRVLENMNRKEGWLDLTPVLFCYRQAPKKKEGKHMLKSLFFSVFAAFATESWRRALPFDSAFLVISRGRVVVEEACMCALAAQNHTKRGKIIISLLRNTHLEFI